MAKASWSYRDESDEISTVELNIPDVSAGGADFDAVLASLATLGAAILASTECVQARETFLQGVDTPDPTTPSDPHAARESGLRIFYGDDSTGKVYHITVPGPDWDSIDRLPNTDFADMADEPLATLIAAMESDAESPEGNAITVLRAVKVGRHN
jgi:hypothetical protein